MIGEFTYRFRVTPAPTDPSTILEDPHLSSLRPAVTAVESGGLVTVTAPEQDHQGAYHHLLRVLSGDPWTCYRDIEPLHLTSY